MGASGPSLAVLAAVSGEGFRIGLLVTTFGFGLRHGIDWDHIAAIGDITGSQDTPRRSLFFATLYALGHAAVVLVLGVAAIAFAGRLPDSLDAVMQRVVGVTLIALGFYVLYALVRHGRDFRMRSRWMLVFAAVRRLVRRLRGRHRGQIVIDHDHDHPAEEPHPAEHAHHELSLSGAPARSRSISHPNHDRHRHRHRHVIDMPEDPFPNYGRATAFAVGMIHGIGAETPTQVMVFLTAAGATGTGTGLLLLVVFIAGLIASNTAIAIASSLGLLGASGNFTLYATVSVLIAVFSLALGTSFLAGGSLPLGT